MTNLPPTLVGTPDPEPQPENSWYRVDATTTGTSTTYNTYGLGHNVTGYGYNWPANTTTTLSPACPFCGMLVLHKGLCSRIKAIHYHPNGTVSGYEFFPPTQFGISYDPEKRSA